jgi:hypothetical protein
VDFLIEPSDGFDELPFLVIDDLVGATADLDGAKKIG